jgi:hypothetical protein
MGENEVKSYQASWSLCFSFVIYFISIIGKYKVHAFIVMIHIQKIKNQRTKNWVSIFSQFKKSSSSSLIIRNILYPLLLYTTQNKN